MKILELFSGYGTASFALKRLGIPYEIVGYSDIDKYANQCFKQNHSGKELGDVRLINPNNLEDFDLLTGGFPCQSFSVAGKRLGEADPRGTLFYEIIRIAEVKQPKYMLLENVKGLTNKTFKDTFNKILSELDRIGYNVYWKVLNSKDYGIPQSRARVWFVCFRKDIDNKRFKFPEPVELKIFIKDILEESVDEKYYLKKEFIDRILKNPRFRIHNNDEKPFWSITTNHLQGWDDYRVKIFTGLQEHQSIKKDGISNTLPSAMGEGGGHTPIIIHSLYPRSGNPNKGGTGHLCKEDGTSYTIDTGNMQAIENNFIVRRLTPKECFRLMGFLNDEINLDRLSDTQKYRLAGNGQDVNMVSLIFKEMLNNENV